MAIEIKLLMTMLLFAYKYVIYLFILYCSQELNIIYVVKVYAERGLKLFQKNTPSEKTSHPSKDDKINNWTLDKKYFIFCPQTRQITPI